MKKILVAFMLMAFSSAVVAKADSPSIDHIQKFEFRKADVQSFGITPMHLDAVVSAEIAVTEPAYVITYIDHNYVMPVVIVPDLPVTRCNGPPAGINI